MVNIIIIAIIVCIVVGIVFYLYRAKKRGGHCVGCPYAKECGGNCNGNRKDKCDNTNTETEE